MSQVAIAWGGSLFFVILCAILVTAGVYLLRIRKKSSGGRPEKKEILTAALVVFLPYLLVNLIALSMLYQVDGNYFMTLYSLLILLFAGCLSGDIWHGARKGALAVMLPVLFFQFLIMTTTNWASFMGFTPFRLNKGSYNHVAENREYVTYERRAGQTWEVLSASPEARVISFAEHPWSLVLPAVAQSVDDTFDTWGNPDVAYSVNTFLSYLRFQKTEYLYADPDYFLDETHRRQKMIFEGLKEKGILEYVTGDYAVLYRIKPE